MEPSILFNGSHDHDDPDYLAWLDANPRSSSMAVMIMMTPITSRGWMPTRRAL